MIDVPILNEELKEILDRYRLLVQSIDFDKVESCEDDVDADDWCSIEYLESIKRKGKLHGGFPAILQGTCPETDNFNYKELDEKNSLVSSFDSVSNEILAWSGARQRALLAVYQPGGFISWHTNANASGYNVLFTWSETGDGQWEHIDPKTQEHVIIRDKKGWQCKFGYYGTYDEPDKVLYHSARTNCLRSTIGFIFNGDERGKSMAQLLTEEISES